MEKVIGKLRRKSRLAAEEVEAFFERDEPSPEISERGFNLYVIRSIEKEIFETLDIVRRTNGDAVSILIKGDAGYGKTSLAWQLYRSLKKTDFWEPWFIKANQFSLDEAENGSEKPDKSTISSGVLKAAVSEAQLLNRFPIILLDTVDLLLHGTAGDRDFLRETLLEFLEMRCSLIITCRPQEASWLKVLRGVEAVHKPRYKPPDLEKYDEVEFKEAIEKHVRFFYRNPGWLKVEDHLAQIENLVAREYSFKEICRIPLAMRMLFELYKGQPINSEVNIFGLYRNFWTNKVKSDWRAGHSEPSDQADLSKTAGLTALAMLAEGEPVIEREKLGNWLLRCGCEPDEIDKLRSRGLIRLQYHDSVEFFHQTFFEHSAARGILSRFGAGALKLIEQRLKKQPDDLFMLPIYEQTLLLASNEAGLKEDFEAALFKLLDSGSQIEQSSGVYVYVHALAVSAEVSAKMRGFLRAANIELIKRFVIFIPNMPSLRTKSLFAEVGIIWARNDWTEQTYVLDLLENLAPYHPADVWLFLAQNKVGEYLQAINKKFPLRQAGTRWLKILAALLPSSGEPERIWIETRNLYRHAANMRQPVLLNKIFGFLRENADYFGKDRIAESLTTEFPQYLNREDSYFREDMPKAAGGLWVRLWQADNIPPTEILSDISRAEQSEFQLRAKIYGFADIMQSGSSDGEIEDFFRFLQDLENRDLQAKITLTVLPALLKGRQREQEIIEDEAANVTKFSREKVKKILRAGAAKLINSTSPFSERERQFFNLVREALRQAELAPESLVEIFDFAESANLDLWLDENRFGMFLVDAARGNHPQAQQAINLLTASPEIYSDKLVQNISSKLAQLAFKNDNLAIWHVPLILQSKQLSEAAALTRTLSFLSILDAGNFRQYKKQAADFKNQLIKARSEKLRRAGCELWAELLRLKLIEPASFSDLWNFLEKEPSEIVRAQILHILGCGDEINEDELKHRGELLLSFASSEYASVIRDNSLAALIELITKTTACSEDLIIKTLQVVITSPTDARRISLFGHVISSLIENRVELAAEVLLDILKSAAFNSFQPQPKKNVANRLRSATRKLVRRAPVSLRSHLVEQVPSLGEIAQHIIVEAMFHEAALEMSDELNRLSLQPLAPKTNELIRRHKEARKSGSAWSELYQLIKPDNFIYRRENFMRLDGKLRKQLDDALASAFTKGELERLVAYNLGERLEAITSDGSLRQIIFNLVNWAESNGKLVELIEAARKQNPGNENLYQIAGILLD